MISLMTDRPFAPEAPREILQRLQEIDPNLGFKYLPIGPGCWAITEKWSADDRRRAQIRAGLQPPDSDFDVLGFAPSDATADDALALLLKQLRAKVTEAPAYGDMLSKCIAANAAQAAKTTNVIREFSAELLSANADRIGGKVTSRGAGFTIVGGKVVGTPVTPRRGLTKSERDAKTEMSDS